MADKKHFDFLFHRLKSSCFRDFIKRHAGVLTLLVQHQFRGFALGTVGGDQDKIHPGQHAKAALTAELRFQLGAQIGRLVVQKIYRRTAGQRIGQVHIPPHQRVQLFHFGQALHVQVVDLLYQLALERLKLTVVAQLVVAFPVVQRGQQVPHVGAGLFLGEVFVGHVPDACVDQIVHAAVGVGAFGVAPFTVVLVGGAILVVADDGILQRHAAALAHQLPRCAQQRVDRYIELFGCSP